MDPGKAIISTISYTRNKEKERKRKRRRKERSDQCFLCNLPARTSVQSHNVIADLYFILITRIFNIFETKNVRIIRVENICEQMCVRVYVNECVRERNKKYRRYFINSKYNSVYWIESCILLKRICLEVRLLCYSLPCLMNLATEIENLMSLLKYRRKQSGSICL